MKICAFTSTRADFGILKPLLEKIDSDSFFELTILVTGAHLMDKFGATSSEVEAVFSKSINVDLDQKGDSVQEIANVMECPIGTVRSRIFRAREAIEAQIEPVLHGNTESGT